MNKQNNQKMKFKDWDGNESELPSKKTFSWRPSAYALIEKDNKILMIKSKQHGKWELPGGEIGLNETLNDGLKREVFEETGYRITTSDKVPISIEDRFFYAKDIDEYFKSILMIFNAELENENQEKEKIDFENEISEVRWIETNNLKDYEINKISMGVLKKFTTNLIS